DEAAPPRGHAIGRLRVGVVERAAVPAIGGNLADGVPSRPQEIPERGDVRRARKAARHADDGDRVLRCGGAARLAHAYALRCCSPRTTMLRRHWSPSVWTRSVGKRRSSRGIATTPWAFASMAP